ncbi:MAG: CotH kinase family protein, partial [Bacillota bacterium]
MQIRFEEKKEKPESIGREAFFILLKTGIALAVLIAVFVTVIMLGRSVKTFRQENAYDTRMSIRQADAKYAFSDTAYSVSYELPRDCSDNYLRIGLSGADVYKVAFYNDDEIDYMIINTTAVSDTEFLYFIPGRITEKGYRQITVSPLSGDGQYWVQHVSTCFNPNFADYADCRIVDFEIEKMEITISDEDYAKLEAKRAEALKLGILLSDDSDYVTAKVRADGKTDSAQVRLKGDWVDHLQGDKWSFRIKLDNECFWGMDEMSIQTPETRNNTGEYLIQRFYSQLGGVALRYKFIDVVINGEYRGVFAVEEGFDKRAVENSKKREGAIIKYNEGYIWQKLVYYFDRDTDFSETEVANFEPFSLNKTWQSETLSGYASYAIDGLNRFM